VQEHAMVVHNKNRDREVAARVIQRAIAHGEAGSSSRAA
jgi:hypothetical protein